MERDFNVSKALNEMLSVFIISLSSRAIGGEAKITSMQTGYNNGQSKKNNHENFVADDHLFYATRHQNLCQIFGI
jgi:hypothetical protein